jgi:parvulin-like peptidyl-prolyl isomerase
VLRTLAVFTLIGAALFALDRQLLRPAGDGELLVIPAERARELRRLATVGDGAPPSREQLAALLRAEVDDRLLLRAARERGLDRDDPVIFRRLVQNLRFAGAPPERSDASLFEEAIALGMDRSDPVVRRRLVQRMQLMIEAAALRSEPAEAELRARYERERERHVRPERVRLRQLYFAAAAARAEQVRERLEAGGEGPGAEVRSEPFLHPAEQPLQTRRELGARFGAEFAERVFALPVGRWSGPVASAYGSHLVWVHERLPQERLPFEEVRDPLRYALLAERREQALARALEELRAGVRVVVETDDSAP